ncbi:MAG TPA: DUF4418 family protein [Candidatus Thorarchaeota archaeon]|nr:MAG: hypothetical protein DRO87_06445 [Candidatus Thorarchaeota archaeon]HDD67495.1 DUF4418 family protein [Candidatus Thorarchaeota archaeon]
MSQHMTTLQSRTPLILKFSRYISVSKHQDERMKVITILNFTVFVLGIVVAVAPWTFAPVCAMEMRCWFTRDVETVLGALIAVIGLISMYVSLE